MRVSVKTGVGFALLWILFSLSMSALGLGLETFRVGILIAVFLVLCAGSIGLFLTRREQGFSKTTFLEDFKTAMQGSIVFAIILCAFIYIYHKHVDSTIPDTMYQNKVELDLQEVPDEATYLAKYGNDPTWKDKSYNTFVENVEDKAKTFLSVGFGTGVLMAILVFFSFFYSFFATLILRKVVIR